MKSYLPLFSLLALAAAKNERCLGIVLRGGANKGSYEAGAIYKLVRNLPREEVQYQVVSGISVGALNAAHLASYPIGQEVQMSEDLLKVWSHVSSANFFTNW